MYFANGFVYGGEPETIVKVDSIKVLKDRIMLVCFNNGETRLFDASILSGKVYDALKDDSVFNNCIIDHGVPTWDDGKIDCAPEFMYDNSFEYTQDL